MKIRTLTSFSLLVLLLLISGCTQESERPASEADSPHVTKEIKIAIEADQRILLNGVEVKLDKLQAQLVEATGDERVNIIISVAPDVPMGLVSDVHQCIPVENVAEIRFPLPKS